MDRLAGKEKEMKKRKKGKASLASGSPLVSSLQRMIEICDRAIARAGELEKNQKTRNAGVAMGNYWRGKREFYKDRLEEAKIIEAASRRPAGMGL